ncbi:MULTISPECIES: ABC transporter substrate-binding protein [Actinomadura]|uniref:Extracellular solute-binding protein n=1 Tax=Actinomadura litoris TaxID=2678616 RepID=A0A7K1L9F0_9ACTN|nr:MULTISPECIES: extracellular solute-binding protein [Actinomadura]MBT2207261.1 extracellular solute-binding protein [Actinomadura sp. NEAU-AAG7]MUN41057.1 extracellular solute-binding protein [Actinomadura litoris]
MTRIRRRKLLAGAAIAPLIALLAACGGSDAAGGGGSAGPAKADDLAGVDAAGKAELDRLYKAAKSSGKTTVHLYSPYAPSDPNEALGKVFATFAATYPGIKVDAQLLSGAQLFAKVDGEFASGKRTADAVLSGPSDVGYFLGQKRLAAYDPPTAAKLAADFKEPDHRYNVPFQSLFGLVYNTRLVRKGEAPTTLAGVLDPKWKGRLTFGQPNGVSPTDFSLATLKTNGLLNEDQLKQLNTLVPVENRYKSVVDAVQAVAQGRYGLTIWGPSQIAANAKERGAPIAVGSLTDAWVLNGPGYGVLEGAPNADAAKLLETWLFTPTAQKQIAEYSYNYGTIPGSSAPPGFPDLSGYKLKSIPAKDFSGLLKQNQPRWTAIFGGPKA